MPNLVSSVLKALISAFGFGRAPKLILRQVAALPVRVGLDGELSVLLITSRGNGRLIVPKGNLMRGKADHKAAAIEAREEAGVVGVIRPEPLGSYTDWKRQGGRLLETHVTVYGLMVREQLKRFEEQGQRELVWLTIDQAVKRVSNPGLRAILCGLPQVCAADNG